MPLAQGSSPEIISKNIAELVKAGHKQNQAAAIAYKEAGKGAKDMAPADWDAFVKGFLKWIGEEEDEPEHAQDERLALDRKSVRSYDSDRHLKVERTPISKANVCEYYGSEIPGAEELGLDPQKKYALLRDPAELKKAAETSNGKPLLIKHVPVNADDHQPDQVVGAVGTNAEFEHPYLYNALSVWAREGIDGIEDGSQKELSSAYRYRPDMTPGTYEGVPYDGVMRDIEFNHVALVREGRAGADVVVGDEKPKRKEVADMTKIVLSRKATYAAGVLSGYLMPKLAQDAKFDVTPLLKGVTAKNFKTETPRILAAIKKDAKLAQDMELDHLPELLEHLGKQDVQEGADAEPSSGLPMNAEEMAKKAKDESEAAEKADKDKKAADKKARDGAVKNFLSGKLSAEDMKAYDDMMGEAENGESEKANENEAGTEGGGGKDMKGKDAEPMVSKSAMDAALKKTEADTTAKVLKTANEISAAREFVFPWTGKLAMDTMCANDVYRAGLEALGLADKIKGVDPSAFKTILELQPKPGTQTRMATDETPDASGFASRFGKLTDRIALAG